MGARNWIDRKSRHGGSGYGCVLAGLATVNLAEGPHRDPSPRNAKLVKKARFANILVLQNTCIFIVIAKTGTPGDGPKTAYESNNLPTTQEETGNGTKRWQQN